MKAFAALVAVALCAGMLLADEGPQRPTKTLQGMYLEVSVAIPSLPQTPEPPAARTILAWKVAKGEFAGVPLDGLAVVAVVHGQLDALGSAASVTDLWVDARAASAQRFALVALASEATGSVRSVRPVPMSLWIGEGCSMGYATLQAGPVQLQTRRMRDSDWERFDEPTGEHPPAAHVFYRHWAVTSELSLAEPAPDAEPTVLSQRDVPGAMVGGFMR